MGGGVDGGVLLLLLLLLLLLGVVVVVAAGGGLALANLADRARGELAGSATVQIVEADPELRTAQAEAAAALLVGDPAVAGLAIVPPENVARLLEPWLGAGNAEDAVPIPALIDL